MFSRIMPFKTQPKAIVGSSPGKNQGTLTRCKRYKIHLDNNQRNEKLMYYEKLAGQVEALRSARLVFSLVCKSYALGRAVLRRKTK